MRVGSEVGGAGRGRGGALAYARALGPEGCAAAAEPERGGGDRSVLFYVLSNDSVVTRETE